MNNAWTVLDLVPFALLALGAWRAVDTWSEMSKQNSRWWIFNTQLIISPKLKHKVGRHVRCVKIVIVVLFLKTYDDGFVAVVVIARQRSCRKVLFSVTSVCS